MDNEKSGAGKLTGVKPEGSFSLSGNRRYK